MDSLTQITLGAAVGEVVLGKKVGNRAMLWGAIGGTIPDLDILSNFFMDDMGALAFHRSITHSFFFAFTAPLLFGWLVHRLYQSGLYRAKGYKFWVIGSSMLFLLAIVVGINAIPILSGGNPSTPTMLISGLILVSLGYWFWKNYYPDDPEPVAASWKDWSWLFFWAIFTHPLLDACTAFGTQLFQPFSDYRVAFNNISVVDPIYTLPFLLCVIIASWMLRENPLRKVVNYLGIGISTAYLLFSFYNKYQVNQVFERSLAQEGYQYERYRTAPTIMNNVLWNCIAEGDTAYYQGLYSLWDSEAKITHWNIFPKNRHLLQEYHDDRSMKILRWFSDGYYNIIERDSGGWQFNDLRYGVFGESVEKESDYIFRFILEEKDGVIHAKELREAPEQPGVMFEELWMRIKGK